VNFQVYAELLSNERNTTLQKSHTLERKTKPRLEYKIGLVSNKSRAWLEIILDGKNLGRGALDAADCDALIH
jgi:hypothetical protein